MENVIFTHVRTFNDYTFYCFTVGKWFRLIYIDWLHFTNIHSPSKCWAVYRRIVTSFLNSSTNEKLNGLTMFVCECIYIYFTKIPNINKKFPQNCWLIIYRITTCIGSWILLLIGIREKYSVFMVQPHDSIIDQYHGFCLIAQLRPKWTAKTFLAAEPIFDMFQTWN